MHNYSHLLFGPTIIRWGECPLAVHDIAHPDILVSFPKVLWRLTLVQRLINKSAATSSEPMVERDVVHNAVSAQINNESTSPSLEASICHHESKLEFLPQFEYASELSTPRRPRFLGGVFEVLDGTNESWRRSISVNKSHYCNRWPTNTDTSYPPTANW